MWFKCQRRVEILRQKTSEEIVADNTPKGETIISYSFKNQYKTQGGKKKNEEKHDSALSRKNYDEDKYILSSSQK